MIQVSEEAPRGGSAGGQGIEPGKGLEIRDQFAGGGSGQGAPGGDQEAVDPLAHDPAGGPGLEVDRGGAVAMGVLENAAAEGLDVLGGCHGFDLLGSESARTEQLAPGGDGLLESAAHRLVAVPCR